MSQARRAPPSVEYLPPPPRRCCARRVQLAAWIGAVANSRNCLSKPLALASAGIVQEQRGVRPVFLEQASRLRLLPILSAMRCVSLELPGLVLGVGHVFQYGQGIRALQGLGR